MNGHPPHLLCCPPQPLHFGSRSQTRGGRRRRPRHLLPCHRPCSPRPRLRLHRPSPPHGRLGRPRLPFLLILRRNYSVSVLRPNLFHNLINYNL